MRAGDPWRGPPVDDLVTYALAAQDRGVELGTISDLIIAIDAYTHLERDGGLSAAERWEARLNRGECLRVVGKLTGNRGHLDAAVTQAKKLSGEPAPDRAAQRAARHLLARTLHTRYEALGEELDSERSLGITRELLGDPDAWQDPLYYALLNQAAHEFEAHFVRHARIEDLEAAVELRRDALAALERAALPAPVAKSQRTGLQHGLGATLLQLYQLRGNQRDLKEAIDTLVTVVHNTKEGDAAAPGFRTTLSDALLALVRLGIERDGGAEARATALVLVDDCIKLLSPELPPGQRRSQLAMVRMKSLTETWQWHYLLTRNLEDLARALEVIERGLADFEGSHDTDLLLRRAEVYRERHGATGAAADLERAVASYEEVCSRHPDSVNTVRDAGNWGDWAMQRGSWEEAARAYDHALRALRSRHEHQSLDRHKEEWLHESRFIPAHAAYSLVRCGQPDRAAAAAEQGRALLLAEVLQRETADLDTLREQGRGDLADRFEAACARLAALRTLPERDPGQEAQAQKAFSAAVEAIRSAGHQDFLVLPGEAPVRDAMPGTHMVYLFSSVLGTAAVIVPPGQDPISTVRLDSIDLGTLTEKVNAHLTLQQNRGTVAQWQQHLEDLTRWCWTHVMGPLLKVLPPGRPCVLIPSGPLSFLPLHAAWEPDPTRPSGRRYALDMAPFGYAPSATALLASTKRPGRSPGSTRGSLPIPAIGVHDPADGREPLPFAALEIDALRSVEPAASLRITGVEATTTTVLSQLSQAGLIHFACHGMARLDDPLSSCLFLADGPLTLRELSRHRGSVAELAILSGCETGLVGTALPDEAVGLPAGFLQAGFSAVIASLWAVPDIATALLMTRFYQLCGNDGLTPIEALRQAQCWVRDATNDEKAAVVPAYEKVAQELSPVLRRLWGLARAHTSPYYWAAFTCSGDGL